MHAVKEKLQSRRGASILMALLFLLVAMMVSVVIIAAAVSAAKSVRSDREQQQAYLTGSSAAGLMRDAVLAGSGDYRVAEIQYYLDDSMMHPREKENKATEATGPFSELLNEAIPYSRAHRPLSYSKTLEITAEGYEAVTAEFTLLCEEDRGELKYTLTAKFSTGAGTAHACRMDLTMTGTEQTTQTKGWSGTRYAVTNERFVSWVDDGIQRIQTKGGGT